MKYLAFIVIFGLLVVSVFGFAAMAHGAMGCESAASGMAAGDCPQALASMAVHHISAYTSFLGITISYATALILSMLAGATIAYFLARELTLLIRAGSRPRVPAREDSYTPQRRKLHHWLTLFELSPSTA